MGNILLSQSQLKVIIDLIRNDIMDLTNHPEFFEECGYTPKEYIDERIKLCVIFKIDFWNTVDLFCSPFASGRLKAMYEGQSIKHFTDNYLMPTESEVTREFLKVLIKEGKNNNNG